MKVSFINTNYIPEGFIKSCENYLSSMEISRANKFFHAKDRCNFIVAHWLKRKMLSEHIGFVDPKRLKFGVGKFGKPYLNVDGVSGVKFNLSHSNSVVACTVNTEGGCGIDVESYRNITALPLLIKNTMTAQEQKEIDSSMNMGKEFLDRWVIKEAILKDHGKGLSSGVDNICTVSESTPVDDQLSIISGRFVYQYKSPEFTLAASSRNVFRVKIKEIRTEIF